MPNELTIDVALVRRLVSAQFPQWRDLPIRPVTSNGWDNRTFRLGDHLAVRLPSAARYRHQVEKEQRWLPILAPRLPLPIPSPVALGRPGDIYPWHWSIYRWLEGDPAATAPIADQPRFAHDLAQFLIALQQINVTNGPEPGPHNFFRGGSLAVYDQETRRALDVLGTRVDAARARPVWDTALSSTWSRPPVWVHGDVSAGNLLVTRGRLAAVIDFGSSVVGDPACDLAIAWTFFDAQSRRAFRDALHLDDGT
jgi:aminoglycoside phosphotransferase (APT) family kinase protein